MTLPQVSKNTYHVEFHTFNAHDIVGPSSAANDYSSINMTLTFSGGATRFVESVSIIDNSIHDSENSREFKLSLSLISGANVTLSPDETLIQIMDNGKEIADL